MRMQNKIILFTIGIITSLLLSSCCPPFCPPRPSEWTELSYDTVIPLGFRENNFEITEEIYAGHDVERFKLKMRISPGNWITGVKIYIFRGPYGSGGLVQTIDALPATHVNGDFETAEIVGRNARITVTSSGNFLGLNNVTGSYLFIKSISIKKDTSVASDYVPPTSQPLNQLLSEGRAMSVHRAGGEVNGFFTGLVKTNYYYVQLSKDDKVAIYVSPLCLSVGNKPGLSLYTSTTGFIHPSDSAYSPDKRTPLKGDAGIYFESGPYNDNTTLYLSLHSVWACSYTITATNLIKKFDIVFEMSDGLKDQVSPALDPNFYAGTIKFIYLDEAQHKDYLSFFSNTSYVRRLKEVIVLSSADMLAASEGQMRIKRADIYESEHLFLNTDVFVHQTYDRAYTSPTKINIYKDELDEPVRGGATLHHEWGHFEYGLDDEYIDLQPSGVLTIDPNSVMGTSGYYNGAPGFEFCSSLNHKWTDNWDPTLADDESNFDILYDQYWGFIAPPYPDKQGRYHDVLHALESYITFNYYDGESQPAQCHVDSDCPFRYECLNESCVPSTQCRVDSDCPSRYKCLHKTCVPRNQCSLDSDCGGGSRCRNHQCVSPDCTSNHDCGAGEACMDGFCMAY